MQSPYKNVKVDGKWNRSKFIKIEKEKEQNCKQFYQTKQNKQTTEK